MKQLTNLQLELLRSPLPKEAITPHPSKTYLSTIKAIYVIEALNTVFGIGSWSVESNVIPVNGWPYLESQTKNGKPMYTVVMETLFTITDYGISHRVVTSSTNDDIGDAAKGATTAAISKVGSYLEIGKDVYKGNPNEGQQSASKPSQGINLPWLNDKTADFWEMAIALKGQQLTQKEVRLRFKISRSVAEQLDAAALLNKEAFSAKMRTDGWAYDSKTKQVVKVS